MVVSFVLFSLLPAQTALPADALALNGTFVFSPLGSDALLLPGANGPLLEPLVVPVGADSANLDAQRLTLGPDARGDFVIQTGPLTQPSRLMTVRRGPIVWPQLVDQTRMVFEVDVSGTRPPRRLRGIDTPDQLPIDGSHDSGFLTAEVILDTEETVVQTRLYGYGGEIMAMHPRGLPSESQRRWFPVPLPLRDTHVVSYEYDDSGQLTEKVFSRFRVDDYLNLTRAAAATGMDRVDRRLRERLQRPAPALRPWLTARYTQDAAGELTVQFFESSRYIQRELGGVYAYMEDESPVGTLTVRPAATVDTTELAWRDGADRLVWRAELARAAAGPNGEFAANILHRPLDELFEPTLIRRYERHNPETLSVAWSVDVEPGVQVIVRDSSEAPLQILAISDQDDPWTARLEALRLPLMPQWPPVPPSS